MYFIFYILLPSFLARPFECKTYVRSRFLYAFSWIDALESVRRIGNVSSKYRGDEENHHHKCHLRIIAMSAIELNNSNLKGEIEGKKITVLSRCILNYYERLHTRSSIFFFFTNKRHPLIDLEKVFLFVSLIIVSHAPSNDVQMDQTNTKSCLGSMHFKREHHRQRENCQLIIPFMCVPFGRDTEKEREREWGKIQKK